MPLLKKTFKKLLKHLNYSSRNTLKFQHADVNKKREKKKEKKKKKEQQDIYLKIKTGIFKFTDLQDF